MALGRSRGYLGTSGFHPCHADVEFASDSDAGPPPAATSRRLELPPQDKRASADWHFAETRSSRLPRPAACNVHGARI